MGGRPAPLLEDPCQGGVEVGEGPRQQGRVEVALQRGGPAEELVGPGEREIAGHPHDVGAGVAHGAQQRRRARAEVDAGDAETADRAQHPAGGGLDVGEVVVLGELPDPGVEELHGARTGEHLGAQEGDVELGDPVEQLGEDLGPLVHEGPRALVPAGGAALDEIGGHRVRGAGETDERGGAQLGDGEAHRLADGLEGLVGQGGQGVHVGLGAHRPVEHRPDAGDDVDADPGQPERGHDVGVEDRGVHPVAAHGLEGQLGGESRGQAALEHRRALAGGAVLGQ